MFYVGANVDPRRDVQVVDGPVDELDHAAPFTGAGAIGSEHRLSAAAGTAEANISAAANANVFKNMEFLIRAGMSR